MSRSTWRTLLVCFLVLLTSVLLAWLFLGSPPENTDNLPPGVKARLGTTGYRAAGFVADVAISPNGNLLALASQDKNGPLVILRNLSNGKELHSFRAEEGTGRRFDMYVFPDAVAFSPDGTILAATLGGTIYLWDSSTGKRLHLLKTWHQEGTRDFAFSPDGKVVASIPRLNKYSDHSITLWDVNTGKKLRELRDYDSAVETIQFDKGGSHLLSSSPAQSEGHKHRPAQGGVYLWDWQTGQLEKEAPAIPGRRVRLSPDGHTVAFLTGTGDLGLHDLDNGRELWSLQKPHNDWHWTTELAWEFSPDGKMIAVGGPKQALQVHEVATGRKLPQLVGVPDEGIRRIRFSPDSELLAMWYGYGQLERWVRIWDVRSRNEVNPSRGHQGEVSCLACSSDGKWLASGSADHTVRIWRSGTGKEVVCFTGHREPVRAVAFAPDGQTVASGDVGNTVCLWEAATGRQLRRWERSLKVQTWEAGVATLLFAPDGRRIRASGTDGTLRQLSVEGGKEEVWEGKGPAPALAIFSPDGQLGFWLEGQQRKDKPHSVMRASLRGLPDGEEQWSLQGDQREKFWGGCFSPDGEKVALIREPISEVEMPKRARVVQVLQTSTGREVARLMGRASISAVAISPDGRFLAMGCDDDTVYFWDLAKGREVRQLVGHAGRVVSLQFFPDGKSLASGSADNTVLIWDLARLPQLPALP